MRFIYLLLITFIFASCGNQKVRFVRSNSFKKQEIVEVKKADRSRESAATSKPSVRTEPTENSSNTHREASSELSEDQFTTTRPVEEVNTDNPKIVDDSLRTVTPEQAEINETAAKAETAGNLSVIFGSLSPFVLVVSAFAALILWDEIVIILGLFATLVFGLAAIIFAILSLRSKYNTKKGRRNAIIGLSIGIPFFALSTMILSLIAAFS